jgi:hypothetical protein
MDSEKFWQIISYGYFISATVCLLLLAEFLILGRPYITIFLLIFILVTYFNLRLFKILK